MTATNTLEMYKRAAQFEQMVFPAPTEAKRMVKNDFVAPVWISGRNSFYYIRELRDGFEYRLVNAETGQNDVAFDHHKLAEALSQESGEKVSFLRLPIRGLEFYEHGFPISFEAFGDRWSFDGKVCVKSREQFTDGVISPDGTKSVVCREYNLWLIDLATGDEHQLTLDGNEHCRYGAASVSWGFEMPGLQVLWSPDSKQILTTQRDTSRVRKMTRVDYLGNDEDPSPAFLEYQGTWPSDEDIELHRVLVIVVDKCEIIPAIYDAIPPCRSGTGLVKDQLCWWSQSGDKAFFVDVKRAQLQLNVVELDSATGETRILFSEESDSCIYLSTTEATPCFFLPLPETGELIWFSERSGHAHLYLYDLSNGVIKNTITCGDWLVREVLHLDLKRREVFVQTAGRHDGRDPYYTDLCRVDIDTGNITTIASSDHEYTVLGQTTGIGWCCAEILGVSEGLGGVSPSGDYAVYTRSRVDEAPISILVDRDGNEILEIETCDTSGLPPGWQWPEPVKMLSPDNVTDLYGVIFRPSNFVPGKKYPVIDATMGWAEFLCAPKACFGAGTNFGTWFYKAAAIAELGFIVVAIDGRGMPAREKSFRTAGYGWIPDNNNTDDRIAGILQLSERYPEMDIENVGIVGWNGSVTPLYSMLQHAEFYKVGVTQCLQDPRYMANIFGEHYEGRNPRKSEYAEGIAHNLDGKLLMIHGMSDVCDPPVATLRMAHAFQKANKDFDMLLLPTEGAYHHIGSGYAIRRVWDYFTTHLRGGKPPEEFLLVTGQDEMFGLTGRGDSAK